MILNEQNINAILMLRHLIIIYNVNSKNFLKSCCFYKIFRNLNLYGAL